MQKSIEQIRCEHDAALSALEKSAAMLRSVSAAASDKLSAVKAEIEPIVAAVMRQDSLGVSDRHRP